MKAYSIFEKPICVFGIADFDKRKTLERLPEDVISKVPSLDFLGRRSPGARVGFRTNSESFTVRLRFKTLSPDIGMSIYSCQSANVFIGKTRRESRFCGLVNVPNYDTPVAERTFKKGNYMEEVLILLPRNEIIEDVEILIEDDAIIEAATPYKYPVPILYYGSSITEGGCCCNPYNAYNAIISRHLDVDYYNFGFSGSCKGESEMADYFNTLDFSIFVLDYDHNAPTPEHLEATHYPFYKKIRDAKPTVPIIMLTRPRSFLTEDEEKRRDVVKSTYERALFEGDENVYFFDGTSFFNDEDGELCFVDCCHPNDLGFHKMAKGIEPLIKNLLGRS